MPEIWTVGHSNKSADDFLSLLASHRMECVADVRRYPLSRRHPHFGIDSLRYSLRQAGISYSHFPGLGGRRPVRPASNNTNWRNEAFRGYADYMETAEFADAVKQLKEIASQMRTTILCAEALWWQCHRSLISDFLKAGEWTVTHILANGRTQSHPFTSAARIVAGRLSYREESLFP